MPPAVITFLVAVLAAVIVLLQSMGGCSAPLPGPGTTPEGMGVVDLRGSPSEVWLGIPGKARPEHQ
jgi:hypothetical protein